MQIVIDIPEEVYKASAIIDVKYEDVIQIPLEVIKNGTLLPKGHGKIGDLDAVMSDISTSIEEMSNIGITVDGEYLWAKLNDAIHNAPAIIEADKEE